MQGSRGKNHGPNYLPAACHHFHARATAATRSWTWKIIPTSAAVPWVKKGRRRCGGVRGGHVAWERAIGRSLRGYLKLIQLFNL